MTGPELLARVKLLAKTYGVQADTADADIYKESITKGLRQWTRNTYCLRRLATMTVTANSMEVNRGNFTYDSLQVDCLSLLRVYANDTPLYNYDEITPGVVTLHEFERREDPDWRSKAAGTPKRIIRYQTEEFLLYPKPDTAAAAMTWKADGYYIHPVVSGSQDKVWVDEEFEYDLAQWCTVMHCLPRAFGEVRAQLESMYGQLLEKQAGIRSRMLALDGPGPQMDFVPSQRVIFLGTIRGALPE